MADNFGIFMSERTDSANHKGYKGTALAGSVASVSGDRADGDLTFCGNTTQIPTRRDALHRIGAAFTALEMVFLKADPKVYLTAVGFTFPDNTQSILADSSRYYPSGKVPVNAERVAIAHWHYFSRSIDNKDWPSDYYEDAYLAPGGERGIHLAYGGYLRNRPLPRPTTVSTGGAWRIADAKDEITMAERMGVDCFQMNEGGGYSASSKTQIMLSAAASFPSFKVMLSIDCDSIGILTDDQVADYFNAFRSNEAVLRHSDGRLVVGCYRPEAIGTSRWSSIISKIDEAVFFIPTFLDVPTLSSYIGLASGMSIWRGNKFSDFDNRSSMYTVAAYCAANGLEFAAQVMPQDHRPRSQVYCEARGSRNLIAGFDFARANTGRYLIIGTWNDYAEGHAIQPSTQTQFGYSDLARYYLSWWKGDALPTIERDAFYYFYRLEQANATGTGVLQTAPRFSPQAGSDGPYDEIEILAFLTSPARLQINDTFADVGAGVQRLRVPWALGVPVFKIIRDGQVVSQMSGGWATRSASDYQDLLYRSGSSLRVPITIS